MPTTHFLTDDTVITVNGNGTVEVLENGRLVERATFPGARTFPCSWLVDYGYTEDGDPIIRDCAAVAVGFDNGWACEAGHSHHTYGGPTHREYLDTDEIEAIRTGNAPVPSAPVAAMNGARL